jgi:hypothetical protein
MTNPDVFERLEPGFQLTTDLALALMKVARDSLREARLKAQRIRHPGRNETLKPGLETPLWSELAKEVTRHLVRHGDKARLARILGLPRQRIYDLLNRRRYLPDAERTLLLLIWLDARRKGEDLG